MASSITISTGPLSSTLSTPDDTKAQNVLLNFAAAIGIPDDAEPQDKLDGVVAHLAEYMQRAARERWFQAQSQELREEAVNQVHW